MLFNIVWLHLFIQLSIVAIRRHRRCRRKTLIACAAFSTAVAISTGIRGLFCLQFLSPENHRHEEHKGQKGYKYNNSSHIIQSGQWSMVSGQWSVVNGQWNTIQFTLLAVKQSLQILIV